MINRNLVKENKRSVLNVNYEGRYNPTLNLTWKVEVLLGQGVFHKAIV